MGGGGGAINGSTPHFQRTKQPKNPTTWRVTNRQLEQSFKSQNIWQHTHTDNTCVYFCVCIHEYMYVLCDIYRFLSIFKKFATATFALPLAWRQQQTFCPGHISSGTSSCQTLVLSLSLSLSPSIHLFLSVSPHSVPFASAEQWDILCKVFQGLNQVWISLNERQ